MQEALTYCSRWMTMMSSLYLPTLSVVSTARVDTKYALKGAEFRFKRSIAHVDSSHCIGSGLLFHGIYTNSECI